jgi:hypothetical protein
LVPQSLLNPDANARVFGSHSASVGPMDTQGNEGLWISVGYVPMRVAPVVVDAP